MLSVFRIELTMTAWIDADILVQVKAAKIRLRFDKVVRTLCARLNAALTKNVPDGRSIVFTVTAPIKRPAETAAALESLFRGGMPKAEVRKAIRGNHVRARLLSGVAARRPKVMLLVHNPDSDSSLILAVVESIMRTQKK